MSSSELHVVDVPTVGALHRTIRVARAPDRRSVYVAHPITGIRMPRIFAMQDEVERMLDREGAWRGLCVRPLFPMRTTHLSPDGTGANVYEGASGHFVASRHFTLQNRLDAIAASDAVLVHYDLADDEGRHRVSNGIPFDIGWASAAGRPVVEVRGAANPNTVVDRPGLGRVADLAEGVAAVVEACVERRAAQDRVLAEIVEFGRTRCADALATLAEADVRRHRDGCRALLVVLPGGTAHEAFHGQVAAVADWVVETMDEAMSICGRLAGDPGASVAASRTNVAA